MVDRVAAVGHIGGSDVVYVVLAFFGAVVVVMITAKLTNMEEIELNMKLTGLHARMKRATGTNAPGGSNVPEEERQTRSVRNPFRRLFPRTPRQ